MAVNPLIIQDLLHIHQEIPQLKVPVIDLQVVTEFLAVPGNRSGRILREQDGGLVRIQSKQGKVTNVLFDTLYPGLQQFHRDHRINGIYQLPNGLPILWSQRRFPAIGDNRRSQFLHLGYNRRPFP